MTDVLRHLMENLVADEPPLRADGDGLVAAGLRLRTRRRGIATASGAFLTVAAVASVTLLPHAALTANEAAPGASSSASAARSASPRPTRSAAPKPSGVVLQHYQSCSTGARQQLPDTDGSVLPAPQKASAAVLAAGPRIAPGMTLTVWSALRVDDTPKYAGKPVENLAFHLGDRDGTGEVVMQLMPEAGDPAVRAENGLLGQNGCIAVTRRDFPDGSVALYYPYGPPAQEAETMHVWFYSAHSFTMNIGMFPEVLVPNVAPLTPAPEPTSLPRSTMPLTIEQLFELAAAAANA